MTKVTFLGGCHTVGASSVLVEHAGARVVMDYGTAFNGTRRVPLPIATHNLTSVLSHAHLDHSGSLPLIAGSQTHSVPMYSTTLTKKLVQLLLADMLRIGGNALAFEKPEVQNLLQNTETVGYEKPIQVHPKMRVTLLDAGHIPGSASILVETEANGGGAARILYTGDLNTRNTQLVNGAANPRRLGELDLVIIESTYALEHHPSRKETEKTFIEATRTTLEEGGTVLVPAFAVGRSQEIMMVINRYRHRGLNYPIFVDGMARKVTRVMLENTKGFSGGNGLTKVAEQAVFIRNESDREAATQEPAIIIAPAGMLKGGSAQHYLQRIAADARSSVFLVGKQLPGTPGAELLENQRITLNSGKKKPVTLKVKAKVNSFNFSCHVDRTDILNFVKRVQGNPKILTMHGQRAACENLAKTLRTRFGYDAIAATCGEMLKLQ
ncbi:MAG: MBL fold metallo-hydrolase [Candidatus Hodarchaeota archaeon]